MTIHLADLAAQPHTDEQVAKLRSAIAYDEHVELRTIGGRLAIYEKGGDAVAFIVATDASRAKAWVEDWSAEVARKKRVARER